MNRNLKCRAAALSVAVAAALTFPVNSAHAVRLSHDGTGQVLIFPYYTVNGGNQTVVSVVNTTNRVKGLRVRFNEARNGQSAVEFNLYLAPYDTWVGAVVSSSSDSAGPARLITQDRSCTVPRIDAVARPQGYDFRNYYYTGSNRDHPTNMAAQLGSLARTREGFIEMIEMGELRVGSGPLQLADEATPIRGSAIPVDCDRLVKAWIPSEFPNNWSTDPKQEVDIPTGGLYGNVNIIDIAKGTMLSAPATALTDFYTDISAPAKLHTWPGNLETSLSSARNGDGFARGTATLSNGQTFTETFPAADAIDAVSLTLMQTRVTGEFLIDPELGASTEWVMTYPTKRFYVNHPISFNPEAPRGARRPFPDYFFDDGKGEILHYFRVRDRVGRVSEGSQGFCDDLTATPPPCPLVPPSTNNSANVFLFTPHGADPSTLTPILGARVGEVADVLMTGFNFPNGPTPLSGWAELKPSPDLFSDFYYRGEHVLQGPTTGNPYLGLPVIGFSVTRVINNTLSGGVLANYAGATPLRGEFELSRPR